ncbi:MAG: hypothetical protein WAO96_04695 [Limnochordia bacterium]
MTVPLRAIFYLESPENTADVAISNHHAEGVRAQLQGSAMNPNLTDQFNTAKQAS